MTEINKKPTPMLMPRPAERHTKKYNYRVYFNGKGYRPQRRVWGLFWIDMSCYESSTINLARYKIAEYKDSLLKEKEEKYTYYE